MKPTKAERDWKEFELWCLNQAMEEGQQFFIDNFPTLLTGGLIPKMVEARMYFFIALRALGRGEELENEDE